MERKDIKRNKLMRAWFRYRKLIALASTVLLLVIVVVAVAGNIGNEEPNRQASATEAPSTEAVTQAPTEPVTQPTEPVTEPVTEPPKAGARPVGTEEFVSQTFYEDAVILGDTFVAGLENMDLVDTKRVVADINWTVGRAESRGVSRVAALNPGKVVIEVGINDFNYEGKTTQRIYEDFVSLVAALNKEVPGAKIYLVSVFPVSAAFESKSTIYIENSKVREVNEMLSALEGVTYIDLYDALSDEKGYLSGTVSKDGLHILRAYYPYILNSIAELGQE